MSAELEQDILLNSLYVEHQQLIAKLQCKLKRDIALLLSHEDDTDAQLFAKDKVMIFRFLHNSQFDPEVAFEQILDTVRWRAETRLAELSWEDMPEWFSRRFSFFHKVDRVGRPVVVVLLRDFPPVKGKSLNEHVYPFVCLVVEMARRLTHDITFKNAKKKRDRILKSRITIIIDVASAPLLSIETELVKAMSDVMDKRFPGLLGSIYVLNFGWMYRGLWQLLKLVLKEETTKRIIFCKQEQLLDIVAPENLLAEFGGTNDFVWNAEDDPTLQRYGRPFTDALVSSDISSLEDYSDAKDSFESSSSDWSPDEFYDTSPQTVVQAPSPKLPTIPFSDSTCLLSNRATNARLFPFSSQGGNASFMTLFQENWRLPFQQFGNHIIIVNSEEELYATDKQDQECMSDFPRFLTSDDPLSTNAADPVRWRVRRWGNVAVYWAQRVIRVSLDQKGPIYWVLFYILLRGPVERAVRKTIVGVIVPQKLTYATVVITATVSAIIGSSISSIWECF